MSSYSELSDFEINKRVARLTGNYGSCEPLFNAVYLPSGRQFDAVNKPEQAWPIIAANKINIIFDWNAEGIAGATGKCPGQEHEDANPLRAAMIIYLMMQEQRA